MRAAGIDELHAVQLARHLADLRNRRRFTDLEVPLPLLPKCYRDRGFKRITSFITPDRCGAVASCSRCTRAW